MIEINEWCPVCKDRIVSVSRGIPSMGVCAKGHRTDRRQVLRVNPEETPDVEKMHRHEAEYRDLWRAVEGGLKSAQDAHPEIIIPNTDSVVKRIVGQVLASGRSC